ncbi:Sphingomyelinase C precursor [Piscirickettsia salmonis]|uniref:Nuclease n=1 Tax=Piscirickettsia salmonis TaxID=1238 RepID=A0A1L6TB67_PISSA|nr:sphingomyelin phosphodiesterase [Piscirickettsia salmonis]AKP73764.1 nuclease [Piscirickettsia salmonis LF-89 = ATCC VR-1361]ALB22554.1 nuclease [Piscirickettsia salmonis]ALY02577.1 nuclease [Piscirickettsia salmonis]AMA42119.1 nuclease [Piscirickettsia salmonis]AOS34595.1 nuclease [Piscirickettsia salmonis]
MFKYLLIFLSLFSCLTTLFAVDLQIITYNVNLLPNIPISSLTKNLNRPFQRAKLIPEHLKTADIVALQEAVDPIMRLMISNRMKDLGFTYKTPVVGSPWCHPLHPALLNGGVIIYSKYKFVGSPQQLIYPRSTGWESISNKGAMYVPIEKDGVIFNIFATHTQSVSTGTEKAPKQMIKLHDQINHLATFISNLNIPANQPILVLGHFNSNSGNIHQQEKSQYPLYLDLINTLNAKLAPPYSTDSLPYSYDTVTNSMATDQGPQETLDYIFCLKSHPCPSTGSTTIFKITDSSLGNKPDLSDHYPIQAQLHYDLSQ